MPQQGFGNNQFGSWGASPFGGMSDPWSQGSGSSWNTGFGNNQYQPYGYQPPMNSMGMGMGGGMFGNNMRGQGGMFGGGMPNRGFGNQRGFGGMRPGMNSFSGNNPMGRRPGFGGGNTGFSGFGGYSGYGDMGVFGGSLSRAPSEQGDRYGVDGVTEK